MSAPITGRCQCASVQFELAAPVQATLNCHCSICRRLHGAAFGTFSVAARADFRWTAGEDRLACYASSAGFRRYFCRDCGSPLTVLEDWNPAMVVVVRAALDDAADMRPEGHIFVASKASWHDIDDDLPRHATWPPGLGPGHT